MNRMMKQIVDVAFRVRAWDKAKRAAIAAEETIPPLPRVAVEFARAVAGKRPDGRAVPLYDGVDDEQRHKIVRVLVTLGWFARAGCPIVVLDEPTALGFASVPAPPSESPLEWPLGAAYGLSIGEGAVLVRHAVSASHMPDDMREHFNVTSGVVEMESWSAGVDYVGDDDALTNLVDNTGAAIVRRPDGLTIAERHPSRQAARKRGLNPDHIPSVEFVIGSVRLIGHGREQTEIDGHGSTRSMKVRTVVSPHWTHQPYGPRSSQRRLQWIATHWRGPEDAPVSVHAVRIAGAKKK